MKYNRLDKWFTLMCPMVCVASTLQSQNHVPSDIPNIIFIYTDDQAHWDVGVSSDRQVHTPNLNRLASEGAYFKNFFSTTPVSTPARASLMTSQYACESGLSDFIPKPGHKLYNPDEDLGLPTETLTFAEILRQNGYKTGLVGKWHLGDWLNDGSRKYHPTNYGFDYFMGLTGGGTVPINPPLEKNGVVRNMKGFTTDILTEDAMEFIKSNAKRPFLLCLNYRAPHSPWLPVKDEDWAPYANMDPIIPNPDYPDLDIELVKTKLKEYMASTSGVDRNVGKILSLLEEIHLDKKTIIIYTSDNGYNMGHNGIEHKGNGYWITKTPHPAEGNISENSRPNMYDNSLKVPAIVRWPGVVKPGTVIEENATCMDWYPTLVEIGKSKIPDHKIIRGRSLLRLLRGESVEQWDNDIYAEYSMIYYSKAYMRTYRTPEWKLIVDFLNEGRSELYNLKQDPAETNNLISDCTEEIRKVTSELYGKIISKMKEIKDPLLKSMDKKVKELSRK